MNAIANPPSFNSQNKNSVAVPSTPPRTHQKATGTEQEETISQAFYESHKETIALAAQYRNNGARHAALLTHAAGLRFYFEQYRSVEQL